MPEVVFPLDSQKKFTEQQIVGHNRWHPDIPAQVHVKPGDSFRVHCREWFDGAIVNDDSADDILNAPSRASTCSPGRSPSRAREPATC
jgi:formamidase